MNPKFNLYERKDGVLWSDYLKNLIKNEGAWHEVRYGTKYYDNKEYIAGKNVDITVGKDPASAPVVITLKLVSKEKTAIKDMPREYLHGSLDDLITDLKKYYGDKVSKDDYVTLMKFI